MSPRLRARSASWSCKQILAVEQPRLSFSTSEVKRLQTAMVHHDHLFVRPLSDPQPTGAYRGSSFQRCKRELKLKQASPYREPLVDGFVPKIRSLSFPKYCAKSRVVEGQLLALWHARMPRSG